MELASSSSSKMNTDSDYFDELCCKRPKNDVFLNYLFEDIGKSFVSHLKGGLTRNGFTISDHTMLPLGQDESSELVKAIEDSEIYVVVFSINYPFSIECLDELVLIMDSLTKFKLRKVFPIFFNVDPSQVRNQRGGSFMEAFHQHETNVLDSNRVRKWSQVLNDAGQLSGLTLQNGVNEAEFVLEIIKELEKMQSPQDLHVADYHVGIRSRAEELISKLRLDFRGVLVVAVFGISGIGKTTIVKAVYNRISSEFDDSYFLANIHDHCCVRNWKVELPRMLISCLTQNDKCLIKFNHNDGVTTIRNFIHGRKILLVLDDVDKFQQLEALGIDPACFHNGSRIIVTTRDKHSLGYLPYTSYHIMLLNRRESLTLFTGLMSLRDDPINTEFIEEVVRRAGGLPLVLKVWSRHFKQYEKEQWPSVLETLKRIPHGDVQKQLQMSYDSLPDKSKKLFLDIVCFFDGWQKDLFVRILQDEESGFFPDIEIKVLVDKSLVEIYNSQVIVHHAIREMGQEVIRKENEDEPGQRSRLTDHWDVVHVLRDCLGTQSVEGIRLGYEELKERVTVQVEVFKKMSNLRFIQLLDIDEKLSWSSSSSNDDMSFFWHVFELCCSSVDEGVPYFCFKKLKYLVWDYFPLKCINIDMDNVVVIKLHYSKLKKLWEGFKSLKKLRILDVSFSLSLTKTGDFTGLEKLEELRFRECVKLEELDSSIGCLINLLVLDLRFCEKLRRFPWEKIGKLQSLKEFHLDYCTHLGLEHVKVIDHFLSSLKECSIIRLDLSGCNISKISHEVGNFKSPKYLKLSGNRFRSLPDSLCQLHELEEIRLDDCTNLKSIPNLHPNISSIVSARNCISLVTLPSNMSELHLLGNLDLDGCFKLEPEGLMKVTGLRNLLNLNMRNCNVAHVSSEIGNLMSLQTLNLSENTFSTLPDSFGNLSTLTELMINGCSRLELLPLLPLKLSRIEARGCGSLNIFPSKLFQESFFTEHLDICLSGREVPKWCSFKTMGDVLSFVAPMQQHLDNKICGVIVCAILDSDFSLIPTMLNKTKETCHQLGYRYVERCSMCVIFCPLNDSILVVEPGDTMLLQFDNRSDDKVILSCGLRLIYEGHTVPLESRRLRAG